MEKTIEEWFASHFHNSVVSRDTEIFNVVSAAKEDLKRLLIPAAPQPAPSANKAQEIEDHG